MQTPPAPSPAWDGKVTDMVKAMATAASAGLPPADNTSWPIMAARGSSAATMPENPEMCPTTPTGREGPPQAVTTRHIKIAGTVR